MSSDSENREPSSEVSKVYDWLAVMKRGVEFLEQYGVPGFQSAIVLRDMELDLVEPGHISFSLPVSERLLNVFSTMHGGATGSLVNTAASAAVLTHTGPSKRIRISDTNVSYITAMPAEEVVEVVAKVLRIGKNLAVTSVDIKRRKTNELVAQGRVTHILEASTSPQNVNQLTDSKSHVLSSKM